MSKNFTDITMKNYVKFILPTIFSMMIISIYNMTDGIFVSRKLGPTALAGLNLTMPGMNMIFGIMFMFVIGSSAIIGIQMGAKENEKANKSFSNLIYALIAASIAFIFVAIFLTGPICKLLGASDILLPYSKTYLSILFLGAGAFATKFFTEIFLRLEGKFNLSLLATIAGGVANIAFDYLFIYVLDMGIAGAALGTVLGAFVNGLFGIVYFAMKKSNLRFVKTKIDWKFQRNTVVNGSSEMVTSLSNAFTTFLFNTILLKTVGEVGISSISIVLYVNFLLSSIFIGISMGIQPLLSYNYGAKAMDNIKKLLRISACIITVIGVLSFIIANVFKYQLIGLFDVTDPELLKLTSTAFIFASFGYLMGGFNVLSSGFFTALGNGKYSAIISFSRSIIIKSALVLILPVFMGINGVWLTLPLSDFICLFLTAYFFIKVFKRNIKSSLAA